MQQGTAGQRQGLDDFKSCHPARRLWQTPGAVRCHCLAEWCCTCWVNQNEKQSGTVHVGEPQRVSDLCGDALVTCAAAVLSPVTKRGVPGADCLIPPEPADAAAWCPQGCTFPSAQLLRCITHDDIHNGHDILCILKYVSPIHVYFNFFLCIHIHFLTFSVSQNTEQTEQDNLSTSTIRKKSHSTS